MKKILFLIITLLTYTSISFAKIHQCKSEDGSISYQERPCAKETVKVLGNKDKARKFSEAQMLEALSKMTGKSISELNTPKYRQAAEALVVTDVSKAYAFTIIHEAPLKYCDNSVRNSMNNYKSLASDAILLGKHYYSAGINLKIGDKQFSKSGQELTTALKKMVDERKRKYTSMDDSQKKKLCSETKQALEFLSKAYEN